MGEKTIIVEGKGKDLWRIFIVKLGNSCCNQEYTFLLFSSFLLAPRMSLKLLVLPVENISHYHKFEFLDFDLRCPFNLIQCLKIFLQILSTHLRERLTLIDIICFDTTGTRYVQNSKKRKLSTDSQTTRARTSNLVDPVKYIPWNRQTNNADT